MNKSAIKKMLSKKKKLKENSQKYKRQYNKLIKEEKSDSYDIPICYIKKNKKNIYLLNKEDN